MRQGLGDFVSHVVQLVEHLGMVVARRGVSRSGSVYLTIRRPWLGESDKGFKVRVSDHLPPSGHVVGFVDVRPNRRSLEHLRLYLLARSARTGRASSSGRHDAPSREGCCKPCEVQQRVLAAPYGERRAGDGQRHGGSIEPCRSDLGAATGGMG